MITELNQNCFQDAISKSEPILVDFWATWCGPCMMQGEVLHAFDDAHPSVRIGKVNVDENRDLAVGFGISAIPTMILFKDGKVIESVTGLRDTSEIEAMLRRAGASL